MNPPPPIEVEKAFGNFVKLFGGELISELVGSSPPFANADFLFREQNVVAELKCLSKNVLTDSIYKKTLADLYEKWIAQNRITNPGWGTFHIDVTKHPSECQREYFQILGKPLHTAVEKANRQIKKTKEHLNLPQAKGLLLLVNDGCWSLESNVMLYLADKTLGQRYSGINTMVYFTVNMAARLEGLERDALIWVPASRKDKDTVPEDFLSELQRGWCAHYAKLINQEVPSFIVEDHKKIQEMKFIRRF